MGKIKSPEIEQQESIRSTNIHELVRDKLIGKKIVIWHAGGDLYQHQNYQNRYRKTITVIKEVEAVDTEDPYAEDRIKIICENGEKITASLLQEINLLEENEEEKEK